MYAEFLQHKGLKPICASSATEALPLAETADVIVTGLLLPGTLDGVEFIARLRSDERTRRIPVIVLTACAWNSERERAERAGCDVFLPKPCLPDHLLDGVRRVLASAGPHQAEPRRAKGHDL